MSISTTRTEKEEAGSSFELTVSPPSDGQNASDRTLEGSLRHQSRIVQTVRARSPVQICHGTNYIHNGVLLVEKSGIDLFFRGNTRVGLTEYCDSPLLCQKTVWEIGR